MKFILASNNAHKVEEISAMLEGKIELSTMRQAGLDMEIEENGTTFEENALIKARAVWEATKKPAIADDSGLEVDALGGAPGIYSARYAGEGATDAQRIEKLLDELKGVPDEQRTARFVCCMACVIDENTAFTVRGTCEGVIGHETKGQYGFGYDPIFVFPERGMTMSEITPGEKNEISHRANAMQLFIAAFRELLPQL